MEKSAGSLTSDMKSTELDPVLSFDKENVPEGDEKQKDGDTDVKTSILGSCWFHITQMKIEVVVFVYMFSYMVRSVTQVNMLLDKVCLVHYGFPPDVCYHLANHTDVKTIVEKVSNNYHLGHSLISVLPSTVMVCFIGPWSDIYGRKLPMIIAFIGIISDGIGAIFCGHFLYSRVEYFFILSAVNGFSGGFISIMTLMYSYASDITSKGGRTLKYAFVEVALGMAMPLGALAGGWLYEFSGYVPVFLLSTAGHVFGLAWTLFVLPETRGIGNTDSWRVKLQTLTSIEAFKDSFRTTIKKRPNQGRKQIFLLLLAMTIAFMTLGTTGSFMYIYVHHMYDWGNKEYSTVSSIYSVFGLVAMMIAVPLLKKLRAGDATLGIVGSVSMLVKTVGIGVAVKKEVYFLANFAGLLQSLGNLAARSRISKVVSKNDLGKVFSFVTTAEMMGPILASIIFSQVFNETLNIYPGMTFLILGGLASVSLGVFIWLAFLPKVNYEEMVENEEVDEISDVDNGKNAKLEKNLVV